jgi:hypothetical protein
MNACPRPRWFRWWLFPATGVVHFTEELFAAGGFYTWVTSIGGSRMSMARFASGTLLALVSLTIAAWVARNRYDWLLFALAAILVTNALSHLAGTLLTHSYSPGTLSGLGLWLPLGGAILGTGLTKSCAARWCVGFAVGAAMNAAILLLALNLGRIA